MPFDLIRHDLLMTLKPVPAGRIASIVDDLFLPPADAHRTRRADPAQAAGTGPVSR
jgi:hypothetical protein